MRIKLMFLKTLGNYNCNIIEKWFRERIIKNKTAHFYSKANNIIIYMKTKNPNNPLNTLAEKETVHV